MSHLIARNPLFDNFFEEMVPALSVRPLHGAPLPRAGQIKLDVSEKEDSFYVNAEIPGVDKDNIDLSIADNVVSISAKIEQHDEQREGDKVLRSERYFGLVSRSFQLPAKVNVDTAEASYENGILKLVLPKETGASRKRLEIK